jgi:hypothetical protein
MTIKKLIRGKPQYNESEGTKDFVLYSWDVVIAWAFYFRNTERLEIKSFIAGILLLKGSFY